ncbi:MAG TPA: class I SAM-dependent methyltransferase [Nakamurella sp.]
MPAADWLATAVRLGAQVDTLAAIAAYARLHADGTPADPAVGELLSAITAEVVGPGSEDVDRAVAAQVIGLARTFLRQALELIDNPGRRGGWELVDVPLLQSIGRLSMGVADAIGAFERAVPDFADRLIAPGARLLDIGTGTGWLAIALARAHPTLEVVGIDIFEPALELARVNVDGSGLADRIELRRQDAVTLDGTDRYDAIWVPLPFLPRQAVEPVLAAAHRCLRPDGWVLPGILTGPPGQLGQLLTDVRTVRSGGHPWQPEEILRMLRTTGFADGQEVPRSWPAPVRLFAGRA